MAKSYRIEVSESFNAPSQKVFPYLADFERFMDWNPFPQLDKTTQSTLSSETFGVGTYLTWKGKQIGEGRMETAAFEQDATISHAMTFGTGDKAEKAQSTMTIKPTSANSCEVSWVLTGTRKTMANLIMQLIGLDKKMAKHFSDGLKDLKAIVEN